MTRLRPLPYSTQHITEADIRAVVKVLRSPFLTQGPTIREFENALCRYTKARYCVALSSGTAALHGAYAAAGIGTGDEVITSPLTFAATANMAVALGARVVFADIDAATGNLDPKEVEKRTTKRTKAIIAVDYAGLPANHDALRSLAKKHKLVLIEDAAQGLGATYKGKPIGTQSDMTIFSFHPVKTITTGEGGAVLTNNRTYYDKLLAFRSHGLVKDETRFKHKHFAKWHQEVQILGYNYRLTDMQAALGASQMKNVRTFLLKRAAAARRYDALLKNVPNLVLPVRPTGRTSAWHLYVIRVPRARRDKIFMQLRRAGIGVQVHYLPVYWHPLYERMGYRKGLCPSAEEFCMSCISIPIFPSISKTQQERVVREIQRALAKIH